jgi:hypothetical protein
LFDLYCCLWPIFHRALTLQNIPNHEATSPPVQYNWINSVYGPNTEELPPNMPSPHPKQCRTGTYEDANLMFCLVTGRSITGIIHMVNQTPVQAFFKKQNIVQTANYGSEFMAARQATEQIMDLRYTTYDGNPYGWTGMDVW